MLEQTAPHTPYYLSPVALPSYSLMNSEQQHSAREDIHAGDTPG